jgi:hypothetical protein
MSVFLFFYLLFCLFLSIYIFVFVYIYNFFCCYVVDWARLYHNCELHVIGVFNLFEHCISLKISVFDSCIGLKRLHLFD